MTAPGNDHPQTLAADVARWSAAFRAGQLDECSALAAELTRRFPATAKYWQLLGMSSFGRGELDAALDHLRHAARLDERDATIRDNLGIVLRKRGQHGDARAAFRQAMALAPGAAGICANAAGNELEAGDALAALSLARRAVALAPALAPAWLQLGNALGRLGQHPQAEAALREAVRIRPGEPETLLSLSTELVAQNRLGEARTAAEAAAARDPLSARARINLGSILDRLGELGPAAGHYRRARELEPANLGAWSSELYCLSHDPGVDPEQAFRAHMAFGEHVDALLGDRRQPHCNDRDPARRLRVGVVSGDFRDHPVARFLEPVWRELDPARVELVAYDTRPGNDAIAQRLRALTRDWHDVSMLGDEALAARVRDDAIDILVDHSGHTARNRLGVFARKPAPVQVIWVGYPGTSGLRQMDYRLVDEALAPPGRLDHLFTERLAYLPSMLVFGRPEPLPPLAPAPLARNGFITFGSFNRMNKLSVELIALWVDILRQQPDARLVIGGIVDEGVAGTLRGRFAAAGIAPARLDLLPRLPMAEYLHAHARIDLLLDAFPWSSSTTAHFGLWMGVPTLTLAGQSLVSRLGAAAMTAAGLREFVVESAGEYVATALRVAAEPARLQEVRTALRERLEQDRRHVPAAVARALELRLRQMWQRWCAGLPPCVLY